jgi:hypothetical protein
LWIQALAGESDFGTGLWLKTDAADIEVFLEAIELQPPG